MQIRRHLPLLSLVALAALLAVGVAGVAGFTASAPVSQPPEFAAYAAQPAPTAYVAQTAPPEVLAAGDRPAQLPPKPATWHTPAPTLEPAPPPPDVAVGALAPQLDRPPAPIVAQPSPEPLAPVPFAPAPRMANNDGSIASVDGLVAVVIVGPSAQTKLNITRAEEFAAAAEKHGMEVRRLYSPAATWKDVLANVNGANLVAYWGHGNGWPSPYGPFQESTKNGLGLDPPGGGRAGRVEYYGAKFVREQIELAPNAIVVLSHACYSAGNGEHGQSIPTWDIAAERVDNHASGFLAAGASGVFAYGTGSVTPVVEGLFSKGNRSMDQIFMTRGRGNRPYYGFTGWDDRYLASTRSPGLTMHLDPGRTEGFLRAVSGDLAMTSSEWRAAADAAADVDPDS